MQSRVNTKTRKVSEYEDGAHRGKRIGERKLKWEGGGVSAVESQCDDPVRF